MKYASHMKFALQQMNCTAVDKEFVPFHIANNQSDIHNVNDVMNILRIKIFHLKRTEIFLCPFCFI